MKMKEFGPPGGGARPWRPPLDPPMVATAVMVRLLAQKHIKYSKARTNSKIVVNNTRAAILLSILTERSVEVIKCPVEFKLSSYAAVEVS